MLSKRAMIGLRRRRRKVLSLDDFVHSLGRMTLRIEPCSWRTSHIFTGGIRCYVN